MRPFPRKSTTASQGQITTDPEARPNMPIRDILDRMRHDGCGGRAGKVGLLSGIEGVSSRPVRRL